MEKHTEIIKIAEAFSPYPGPRFSRIGDHSGEEFREKILIPALQKGVALVIDLDDTRGYNSSFLEEAFGGAVRAGHPITRDNVNFVAEDESLKDEVWGYIGKAMKNAKLR